LRLNCDNKSVFPTASTTTLIEMNYSTSGQGSAAHNNR